MTRVIPENEVKSIADNIINFKKNLSISPKNKQPEDSKSSKNLLPTKLIKKESETVPRPSQIKRNDPSPSRSIEPKYDSEPADFYPYDNRKLIMKLCPEKWRNPLSSDFYRDFEANKKQETGKRKDIDSKFEEERLRNIVPKQNRDNPYLSNSQRFAMQFSSNPNNRGIKIMTFISFYSEL